MCETQKNMALVEWVNGLKGLKEDIIRAYVEYGPDCTYAIKMTAYEIAYFDGFPGIVMKETRDFVKECFRMKYYEYNCDTYSKAA